MTPELVHNLSIGSGIAVGLSALGYALVRRYLLKLAFDHYPIERIRMMGVEVDFVPTNPSSVGHGEVKTLPSEPEKPKIEFMPTEPDS